MKFLIQTIDNKVKHDFSFALIEACEYQNWYTKSNDYKCFYTDIEDLEYIPNFIPIGSVEFVSKYLKFFDKIPKPINIPNELLFVYYLGREIKFGNKKDINKFPCFVKSDTKIKKFTEIINNLEIVPEEDKYLISDILNIDSEWRCFIYENKLVGLQNYSGDFTLFPNIEKIKEMIIEYKSSPIAYTLDIAINESGTFLIEVHDFFSCGLYGFNASPIND